MFNLKESNGTYKSLIGECMFKLTKRYVVINKYWSKTRYFAIFGSHLTRQQMEFLNDYWHSIDAIEIDFSKGKKIILYEIKTKNMNKKISGFKPKITETAVLLYNKAIETGFFVQIATICFHNNWNYSIQLLDFTEQNYQIGEQKPYDRQCLVDFV